MTYLVINKNGKVIKQFNDYQKESNSNIVLQEYITKKDYIDYNKDSNFEGKEE